MARRFDDSRAIYTGGTQQNERIYSMCRKYLFLAILVVSLVGLSDAPAWPGFTWEEWQSTTGVTKPDVETAQAGRPELLDLLKNAPEDSSRFITISAWKRKSEKIKHALRVMNGSPKPIRFDQKPAEVLGEEALDGYRRIHLTVPGEEGDRIPAYVLVPDTPIGRRSPAMIVLHQTQAAGKAEAVGMTGDPEMAFAVELVKRGYVCIVPDAIGFGERIPEGGQPYDGAMELYKHHPDWSFFGKMVWENGRMVDYLSTRNDVDMERVGIIGHSHGAYGAIMTTLFDPRIALTVASCGFTTLRTDPHPERWSHLTPLMPRVGFYLDDIAQVPFDWHEVVACLAPRPFFNWATLNDDIFPETDNLASVYEQLGDLYSLYHMEHHFHGELVPGKHQFPKEGREKAYAWLDQRFGVER